MLQDGGGSTRIETKVDFTKPGNPKAGPPEDGYGHGTHVAGIVGVDQAEVKGVAPGVSYVSLKVLSDLGVGLTSDVISAIEWAVTYKMT